MTVTTAVPPRRLRASAGPALLGPLVCLQAAAAALACGYAAGGTAGLGAGAVPAAGLAVLGVVRPGGRSLLERAGASRRLRRRRRQAALAAGAAADGSPADPLATLAQECVPGLRTGTVAGRDGREAGVAADGGGLTVVLRVDTAPSRTSPLRQPPGHGGLPLRLLREALETDGIVLESVRCVQFAQPAPTPLLPARSVASVNYAALSGAGGPPALRLTWVALRLDPELCPAAVAERGGGETGARRCLLRAGAQLASRLAGAGVAARLLTEAELLASVAAAAGADPAVTARLAREPGPAPLRTEETARAWRCDDRWQTTFRVARWPALGDPAGQGAPLAAVASLLTAVPGFATAFGLTLRRHGRGDVALTGHLRVAGRGERELRQVSRAVTSTARGAGVALARMDREQVPGLLATLPVGADR
ncbi:type VII secretion protein EccE [Streptomyces sp. 7-21]|uniref:type VII secretion protein EccE n=1 Tax=Streptomyces sp. 7-21 TaxID=2802283 RepID=UPI00191FF46C|nr:type VII secretion protein EccE [Streptomyces sp. 7-21]MBL1068309.1 type VII secretion protein EccE [Streptomyces sp. 7-21]